MKPKFYKRTFLKTFAAVTFTSNILLINNAEAEEIPPILNTTAEIKIASIEAEKIKEPSPWFRKDRWAITLDFGGHFKQVNFPDKMDIKDDWVDKDHGRKFWGESGISASYGFSYKRIFENKKWFWGSRIVWTWFLPDSRYYRKGSVFTLGSIPIIGEHIRFSLGNLPSWTKMLFCPMVYFDFGYITDNNISFSLGTIYLWGLSPALQLPLVKNLDMEIRSVIFLDKIFAGAGVHNVLLAVGVNWKPWNY